MKNASAIRCFQVMKSSVSHAVVLILAGSGFAIAQTSWLKDIQAWGTMLEGRMQPVTSVPLAKSNDRGSSDIAAQQDGEVQRAVVGQLAKLVGQRHSD